MAVWAEIALRRSGRLMAMTVVPSSALVTITLFIDRSLAWLGQLSRGPKDGIQQYLLIPGIPPHRRVMAERRVEDTPLAIRAGPGKRPAIEAPMHAALGQVDGRLIESQEDMRPAVVEVADLVDLILDLQRGPDKRNQRARGIDDLDSHALVPGMIVEITADKLEIIRPQGECCGCGMEPEKGMA